MLKQDHFEPMTWRERLGCLALVGLVGCFWLAAFVLVYHWGRSQVQPQAITTLAWPCYEEIIPDAGPIEPTPIPAQHFANVQP